MTFQSASGNQLDRPLFRRFLSCSLASVFNLFCPVVIILPVGKSHTVNGTGAADFLRIAPVMERQ